MEQHRKKRIITVFVLIHLFIVPFMKRKFTMMVNNSNNINKTNNHIWSLNITRSFAYLFFCLFYFVLFLFYVYFLLFALQNLFCLLYRIYFVYFTESILFALQNLFCLLYRIYFVCLYRRTSLYRSRRDRSFLLRNSKTNSSYPW